jgi:hypothetical protein
MALGASVVHAPSSGFNGRCPFQGLYDWPFFLHAPVECRAQNLFGNKGCHTFQKLYMRIFPYAKIIWVMRPSGDTPLLLL